jgi:hypothetical protein
LSECSISVVAKTQLEIPALPDFVWVRSVWILASRSPERGSRGIFSLGTSGPGAGRVPRCKIELSTRDFWGSKIQWIKRKACGYRNRKRFHNAIYFHLADLNLYPDSLQSTPTKA